MADFSREYKGTNLGDGHVVDPQVLAEYLDWKLMDAIKFAPLCDVNRDLEGRPGSTLTLPMYTNIDLAEIVPEGADVPFDELGKELINVKVQKAGRGVKITDEAILSAYGNPVDEIAKQLLAAIAGKVDKDCVAIFRGINEEGQEIEEEAIVKQYRQQQVVDFENAEFNKNMIVDMIAKFGEDIEEEMVLLVNPKHLAALRKDDAFAHVMNGQTIISGEMGQIFGCRVVVSNKVEEGEMFLVKAGAVEILMKRNVMVEADRDIVNKTNIFVVDEHYAVYLKNPKRLVAAKNITMPQK